MRPVPGVRNACALLLTALTAGCGARALALNTTGTGGTRGTIGPPYGPIRDVDILFVIDNSSSVRLLQDNVNTNFPTFMAPLRALPGGLPNIHLAVITSDMGAGDGSIASCTPASTGGDAGRFQYTARGTCVETGLDAGATFISDIGGVPNYRGNLEDVFTCIAAVGEQGCGFEQPLKAVVRALGADGRPPPLGNEGFMRPEAYLLIVVVTDEDDCSVPDGSNLFDTTTNVTLSSPLGPLTNFRCNEFGHLCNSVHPPRRAPNGSVNDTVTLDGCMSAESAGMLTPVATLVSQIRAFKQYPDLQIQVAVITGPSAPYTVTWKNPSTADTGPWPVIAHSCTAADGSLADPAVRINQWAAAFGTYGQWYSVCETNYAPALSSIAGHLATLLSPPTQLP